MIALLGQNITHITGSVTLLCLGYFGVVYHLLLLTQFYLLLLPVVVTMTALVNCYVFRSELLATHVTRFSSGAVDTLTGLPGRAAFIDRVWDSMQFARRYNEDLLRSHLSILTA